MKIAQIVKAVIAFIMFILLFIAYFDILHFHAFSNLHYGLFKDIYIAGVGAALTMLFWYPAKRLFSSDTHVAVRKSRTNKTDANDLHDLSPGQFEEFMAELMRRSGYRDVQRIGGSHDLTIDIRATAIDGLPVIVQCKRYTPHRKVGTPEVQQFIGMAYTHHGIAPGHAMYVTTSQYTAEAMRLGAEHEIIMIDGTVLQSLTHQYADAA